MVHKLVENQPASEMPNRSSKMGFQRSIKLVTYTFWSVYVGICADSHLAGERVCGFLKKAMTPKKKKRLKTLQSSKITFLYSKKNFNYTEVTELF